MLVGPLAASSLNFKIARFGALAKIASTVSNAGEVPPYPGRSKITQFESYCQVDCIGMIC